MSVHDETGGAPHAGFVAREIPLEPADVEPELPGVRLLVKMMLSVWMRVGPITIHRSHREDGAGSA